MKARRGVTLVEVMLAGSIAVLLTLACLEGVVVATGIAHENAQLLAAEAYAWDTAWRWLNKPYDDLNNSTTAKFYPDAGYSVVSSNDCPMLCRELNGGADARLYVRVALLSGSSSPSRHGSSQVVKRIDVNVEWGPASSRRRLNSVGTTSGRSFSVPVSVYKGPFERGI
jgi:hypothetical protein